MCVAVSLIILSLHPTLPRCDEHVNTDPLDGECFDLEHRVGKVLSLITSTSDLV